MSIALLDTMLDGVFAYDDEVKTHKFTFVDLFSGIGGFHQAATQHNGRCLFASDIDPQARHAYQKNYGVKPYGDITAINGDIIPDHDVLFAGFPCQPFSIIGKRLGFDDIRGTLFFEIVRVLNAKQPKAFILENVKQLYSHNKGKTLQTIIENLEKIGYSIYCKVLNALDYGLPQKRERTIIVGFFDGGEHFNFPKPVKRKSLNDILEKDVDQKHFVSERIKIKRKQAHESQYSTAIWHENKSGNISSYPYSCALRAGASYNYLLVNGERRLTSREQLRLQGFPDTFKIVCNDSETRKQAGNAVPVPMVSFVLKEVLNEIT